jgi:DDE superfamily endonuclease
MEDVLELDAEPWDESRPVVGGDELSQAWHGPIAEPIPAAPGRTAQEDDESTRNGTANGFRLIGPRLGGRHREVTSRRGDLPFAPVMKALVDDHVPKAAKIRVVLDNRNTPVFGALHAAFSPEEARRIATRREFPDTPQHGSGLNRAEMEFSVLSRPCWSRRIETAEEWSAAVAAWERARNAARTKIEWSFRVADARKKLHWVYPS